MFVIAGMYKDGVGTDKNVGKEIEWLSKLALLPDEKDTSPDRNVTSARIALAQAYMVGDGIPKDFLKSYICVSLRFLFGWQPPYIIIFSFFEQGNRQIFLLI